MHRENREAVAKEYFNLATFGIFKGAPLFLKPFFEFLAVHKEQYIQKCLRSQHKININVYEIQQDYIKIEGQRVIFQRIASATTLIVTLALALPTATHAFCFEQAGREYDIAPLLLWGIARTESGFNPNAINRNTNGTYDFGLMQINSSWAATLGKKRWNALADPCTNVRTGAWILRQCIDKYGYNWRGVGCYNSQTPSKRDRYAAKVESAIRAARVKGPAAQQEAQTAETEPWTQFFGQAGHSDQDDDSRSNDRDLSQISTQ